MRAFRLDDREFSEGDLIPYRGDCAEMLTLDQQVVESALRAYAPSSADIRRRAQYFYLDEAIAERLGEASNSIAKGLKRKLYEVEVADIAILHRGDLNHYSAALDAAKAGKPLDEHVAAYWSGSPAGPPWTSPRYELLATKAVVVRKL